MYINSALCKDGACGRTLCMIAYVEYACCGGKHVFYVGQGSQVASLALEASVDGQSCLGWACVRVSAPRTGLNLPCAGIQMMQNLYHLKLTSCGTSGCVKVSVSTNACSFVCVRVHVHVRVRFITVGLAVSMLLGRGLIGVPRCELVDGRLSPPHPRSQQQSWGLVVSGWQTRDLHSRSRKHHLLENHMRGKTKT